MNLKKWVLKNQQRGINTVVVHKNKNTNALLIKTIQKSKNCSLIENYFVWHKDSIYYFNRIKGKALFVYNEVIDCKA